MKSVNVAELKNRLSAYLSFARNGEEIVIRDRNLPIAKLIPFPPGDASEDEILLVAAGKMRLPKIPLDARALWNIPTGSVSSIRAVDALLKDREEGL
ncbi:MAG: type II toxin-antitoxin system prevent-host-death family antitoxin [Nitrososphaerota archaeon]|nr:type II toxin-antitoxin system prevent-host-death family antitoxin [Nitrososphaerota archaeon]